MTALTHAFALKPAVGPDSEIAAMQTPRLLKTGLATADTVRGPVRTETA